MYYLLEDNRIIDTSKISKNVDKLYVEKDEKGKRHLLIAYYLGLKDLGKIKKQSENVYDLIDWEKDLVRITGADKRNFIIDCNINKSDFLDGYYSLDWITAIYKPDEKGNYIKVWEVKKDE